MKRYIVCVFLLVVLLQLLSGCSFFDTPGSKVTLEEADEYIQSTLNDMEIVYRVDTRELITETTGESDTYNRLEFTISDKSNNDFEISLNYEAYGHFKIEIETDGRREQGVWSPILREYDWIIELFNRLSYMTIDPEEMIEFEEDYICAFNEFLDGKENYKGYNPVFDEFDPFSSVDVGVPLTSKQQNPTDYYRTEYICFYSYINVP